MANLGKTRALFGFTSPRTIQKIIPEIGLLLDKFRGQEWNEETQIAFFDFLYDSGFYEGDTKPKNIPLAARDRITRAPQMLGFVDLKPSIQITPVGEELLTGKRIHETIARQLFKFQLPSPYHPIKQDRNFNVRPYLELLRLIKELGSLSKKEIAIFFLQITNYTKFDSIVTAIKKFRKNRSEYKGNKKLFVNEVFNRELLKIYAPEIVSKNLKTRESSEVSLQKFLKTKRSNHNDYADAFVRYLRATEFISFEKRTFHVVISKEREDEVNYLLSKIDRDALNFNTKGDYKYYLFRKDTLKLLTDEKKYLIAKLKKIGIRFDEAISIDALKGLLEESETKIVASKIEETKIELRNYNDFEDVMDIFDSIITKKNIDPPLYLEWNVWRAFVMLNDAKEVIGNFRLGLDGFPVSTAGGNLPDIEIEYRDFKMIVEVTMSSGNTQYIMEGEPVPRHFGKVQEKSTAPVYCLFIAPTISEGTLAYFFNLNKQYTKLYGGMTRIVLMNLRQFIRFIGVAKDKNFRDSTLLYKYLDGIIADNHKAADESVWFENIENSINSWVN